MKKQLLFAFLAITATGLAQEPITGYYGYINDDLGTTDGTGRRNYSIVTSAAPLDHSATGANLTWNFDQLSFVGLSSYHNLAPSSSETILYPGTTRVVENTVTINEVPNVSRAFLNGWSLTGVENSDFMLSYTDNGTFSPDMMLEYGDNYSETIGGSFTYDGYIGTFSGTITGTVDAYGTLNINDFNGAGATSDAVTRLKIVQALMLEYPPFGVVGTVNFTAYHYYRQGDLYPFFTSTTSDFNIPLLSIDEEQTTMEVAAYGFLSAPEVSQTRISVVPNPTSGIISIVGDNVAVQSVSITDMNGRIVLQNVSSENTIDISSLSSGVYFARVNTGSGSLTKKIIKQ